MNKHQLMFSRILTTLTLLCSLTAFGQTPATTPATDQIEASDEMLPFASSFAPEDVGFLHVYVDPRPDPLETYLFRGVEMSDEAKALLPADFRTIADAGTLFGTMAIMGIDENLYITRLRSDGADRIDMFAIRNDEVVHLKTLAELDCNIPDDCTQTDSYITDLNLDTTFDLVQISRTDATEMEGEREVYTMLRNDREWVTTTELEVPWEGITFYEQK